jgi:hypothetical protein
VTVQRTRATVTAGAQRRSTCGEHSPDTGCPAGAVAVSRFLERTAGQATHRRLKVKSIEALQMASYCKDMQIRASTCIQCQRPDIRPVSTCGFSNREQPPKRPSP